MILRGPMVKFAGMSVRPAKSLLKVVRHGGPRRFAVGGPAGRPSAFLRITCR